MPTRRDRSNPVPDRNVSVAVERFTSPMTGNRTFPRVGVNPAQYAIDAYTATERSEELEYVSTVLGIDEYA